MPKKEINFFSRDRNWGRGFAWYEGFFVVCPGSTVVGEFSTSYLTDPGTPSRIFDRYPQAHLIVSLRHPVERAYSNYLNDIVAGEVPARADFDTALRSHPEYLDHGRYAKYLRTYLDFFPQDQILISLFDDARSDPLATMQRVYRFIGTDAGFRPSMIDRRVGEGRVPRKQWVERGLLRSAAALRRRRALRPFWWTAKRIGVGDWVRRLNTTRGAGIPAGLDTHQRQNLLRQFEPDIRELEELLGRPLTEWRH